MVYWQVPKGPKGPLFRPFKYFNLATPEKYGGSLFKNMLADAPELFVSLAMIGVGLFTIGYHLKQELKYGAVNTTPYKREFIVIRPEDPLIEVVRQSADHYADPMHPKAERPGMSQGKWFFKS